MMDEETCWWIIIETPDGTKLTWPAGDKPGDDELNLARTLAGFPPNDDWIDDESGWAILLTEGRPHADLLKVAHVGTFGDLQKADPAAVASHAATRQQNYANRRAKAAKDVLVALDDEALAAVLADPAVAARIPKGVKP